MTTESEVRNILRYPFDHDWSIQGLGMLRLYLDAEQRDRLHIWDPRMAEVYNDQGEVPSTIHDHPWDFDSRIVSGRLSNKRYAEAAGVPGVPNFYGASIRCGVGGGLLSAPAVFGLIETPDPKIYEAGDVYHQDAPELHESFPEPGAVTVISREFKSDRDIARVFWREGDWVSAEPRPATRQEIEHFITLALSRWDS